MSIDEDSSSSEGNMDILFMRSISKPHGKWYHLDSLRGWVVRNPIPLIVWQILLTIEHGNSMNSMSLTRISELWRCVQIRWVPIRLWEYFENIWMSRFYFFFTMHSLIDSLLHFFGNLSYIDIFVLMMMESSIIPLPSELVMIPAWVSAMNGNIDPFIATIVWWLGSVLWALLNYWIIGRCLGKPFLEKYGKYILITPQKYRKTEDLFLKNDVIYTFIGRLIPVVRHLISIPAGIFRMRMRPFIITTFLWATLWCSILVALGYFFGESVETIAIQYGNELKYIAIPAIAFFIWYKVFKK